MNEADSISIAILDCWKNRMTNESPNMTIVTNQEDEDVSPMQNEE